MAKKIRMLPNLSIYSKIESKDITGTLDVSLQRFEEQYQKAQYQLDSAVMRDMVPYMPMINGTFINLTKARSAAIAGSGKVVAAAPPYGRFLYKGKVMVDEKTGSAWARYGAKKVLVSQFTGKTSAKENIDYSKNLHPRVTAEWFEEAKKVHKASWIKEAQDAAGGGRHG